MIGDANINNISQRLNNLTIKADQIKQDLLSVKSDSPIKAKKEEGVWKFLGYFKIFQRFRQSPEQLVRNQKLSELYEGLRLTSKNIDSIKKEIAKCKEPEKKSALENGLKHLFGESKKLKNEIDQISCLCNKNMHLVNVKLIKKIESEEIGLINRIRNALIAGGNEHLNALKEINQKLKAMETEITLSNQGFYSLDYDPLKEIEKLSKEITSIEKKVIGNRLNDLVQEDVDRAKKLMTSVGELWISLSTSNKEAYAANLGKLNTVIQDSNDALSPLKNFFIERQDPLPRETLKALRVHLKDPANFSKFVKDFKIKGNTNSNVNEILVLLEKSVEGTKNEKEIEILKEGIEKLNAQQANRVKKEMLSILEQKKQTVPVDLSDALEIALMNSGNRKSFKEKILTDPDPKERRNIALILSILETDLQSKTTKLETAKLEKPERIQLEKECETLQNALDLYKEPFITETIEDLKQYFTKKGFPLPPEVTEAMSVSFESAVRFQNFLRWINFENPQEIIVDDINSILRLLQTFSKDRKEIYEKSELVEKDKFILEKQIETSKAGIQVLKERFRDYVLENTEKYFQNRGFEFPDVIKNALSFIFSHRINLENFIKDSNFDETKELEFSDFYLIHDFISKEIKSLDKETRRMLKAAIEQNNSNIEIYYDSLKKSSSPESKIIFDQLLSTIGFPLTLFQKTAFLDLCQSEQFQINLKEILNEHQQILNKIDTVDNETIIAHHTNVYSNLVSVMPNPMYHEFVKDLAYLLPAKLGHWGNIQFATDAMALAISTDKNELKSGPAIRYLDVIEGLKENVGDFSAEEQALINDNYFFNKTYLVWIKNDWFVEETHSEKSPFIGSLDIRFALPNGKSSSETVVLDLRELGEFNRKEKLKLLRYVESSPGKDKNEEKDNSLKFLSSEQFNKLQQIAEDFEKNLRHAAAKAYKNLG